MLEVINRVSTQPKDLRTADKRPLAETNSNSQAKPSRHFRTKRERAADIPNPVQASLFPRGNPQLVEAHSAQILSNLAQN